MAWRHAKGGGGGQETSQGGWSDSGRITWVLPTPPSMQTGAEQWGRPAAWVKVQWRTQVRAEPADSGLWSFPAALGFHRLRENHRER